MIRELCKSDIDKVADIWLNVNLQAHNFVDEKYWKENYSLVKEMFAQAEIYVFEELGIIKGFVGLDQEYIAGLFVVREVQSKGVGKALIDFVKNKKEKLYLKVYCKNERAIKFYQREGFEIKNVDVDEATSEKEFEMLWYDK